MARLPCSLRQIKSGVPHVSPLLRDIGTPGRELEPGIQNRELEPEIQSREGHDFSRAATSALEETRFSA